MIDDYEKEVKGFFNSVSFVRVMAIFFAITTIFLLIIIIFLSVSTKWIPRIAIFDNNKKEFYLAVVKNNSESLILSPEGQGLSPGEKALIVLLVKKNKDGGESFRLEWKMPDEKPSD